MGWWKLTFEDIENALNDSSALRQVDLWLTLLAGVACVETLGVCSLAMHARPSRNLARRF